MTATALVILLAIAAGVAVALQAQFMGVINRSGGTLASIFVTYGVGGLLAAILFAARRPPAESLREIPWYAWTAGVFGLVIVGGIGFAAPRLGLSKTLVLTITAQLLAAAAIDHFGLFSATARPLDLSRAAGLVLAAAGAWLVVKA